jgi:hypothetical protein
MRIYSTFGLNENQETRMNRAKPGQTQTRRNLNLSDQYMDKARALSKNGENASEGIRIALDLATRQKTANDNKA